MLMSSDWKQVAVNLSEDLKGALTALAAGNVTAAHAALDEAARTLPDSTGPGAAAELARAAEIVATGEEVLGADAGAAREDLPLGYADRTASALQAESPYEVAARGLRAGAERAAERVLRGRYEAAAVLVEATLREFGTEAPAAAAVGWV
jgi:hypothetical protein